MGRVNRIMQDVWIPNPFPLRPLALRPFVPGAPAMLPSDHSHLNRRSMLGLAAGAAMVGGPFGLPIAAPAAEGPAKPAKRYPMRKSINLWAFPYPQKMSL